MHPAFQILLQFLGPQSYDQVLLNCAVFVFWFLLFGLGRGGGGGGGGGGVLTKTFHTVAILPKLHVYVGRMYTFLSKKSISMAL